MKKSHRVGSEASSIEIKYSATFRGRVSILAITQEVMFINSKVFSSGGEDLRAVAINGMSPQLFATSTQVT